MTRIPRVWAIGAVIAVAGCASSSPVEASRNDRGPVVPAASASAAPVPAEDAYCRAANEIADAAEVGGKTAHEKLAGGFVIDQAEALDLQRLLSTEYFQGSIAMQLDHDGITAIEAGPIMKSRGPGDPCYEGAIARVRAFAGDLPAIQHAATSGGSRSIAWREDLDVALADAKKTKRGALVFFCAEWAAACVELRHTFAKPRVIAAVTARFVPVRVDMTEETKETQAIADAHGVTGLPTILVVDEEGKTIRQINQFVDEDALLGVLAR